MLFVADHLNYVKEFNFTRTFKKTYSQNFVSSFFKGQAPMEFEPNFFKTKKNLVVRTTSKLNLTSRLMRTLGKIDHFDHNHTGLKKPEALLQEAMFLHHHFLPV